MNIWYRCRKYDDLKIEAIRVVKATDKTLVVAEKRFLDSNQIVESRCAITSEYFNHFRTREEAHQYLVDKAERRVKSLLVSLEQANVALGNLRGMKKPEPPMT